jgi:hypothetical protein
MSGVFCLQFWSREILRHTTHDDFKEQLLPAAQKAMLRNPEVILSSQYTHFLVFRCIVYFGILNNKI